jgi:3-hydroxybutyryl-CoA dehydrogenase
MEVKKVGVIGLGIMGAGIAQVTAQAGYQTVVHDVSGEIIEKAIEGIDRALSRLSEKGRKRPTPWGD